MKIWQIAVGVVLFLTSSMLADLVASSGVELSIGGTNYAVDVTRKVLDVLAGSLTVWGVLDLKKHKKGSR